MAVVLVEGDSDRSALVALASRLGRNLDAEGVSIVAMGGATAIGEHLRAWVDRGVDVVGLCDEGEEVDFRRALERTGFGSGLSRRDMEDLGFYVCVADLEDELIRALGVRSVERIIDGQGELRSLRILQNQPPWRGRPPEAQLRRFMGSRSGRKIRYGKLMVEALDPLRVPAPLVAVLAHV